MHILRAYNTIDAAQLGIDSILHSIWVACNGERSTFLVVVLVSDGIADRNCSAAIWNSGLWVSLASVFQSGINPLRITFFACSWPLFGLCFSDCLFNS